MQCEFCNKKIKTDVSFVNLFQNSNEEFCSNCKNILDINTSSIDNLPHYYFAQYEEIKDIIYSIKYFGDVAEAQKFRLIFKKFFKNNSFDLITIAPTNKTREAIRGFNHAAIICELCDIDYTEIFNEAYRPKQANLHTKRQFHKVAVLKNKIPIIKNIKSILIIDDIFTSGKTLLSLTQEIKKFNPDIQISLLTLAKS